MGVYDRDYIRTPRRSFGNFSVTSVTTWLVGINIAVFLLDQILQKHVVELGPDGELYRVAIQPLYTLGYFSTDKALTHLQLWRFITFQFLHANVGHIFGNMLGLYFFGPMVENFLGKTRFLFYYLSCGVAGAMSFILFAAIHVLHAEPNSPMIGASAGVFGVLVAGAIIAPDTTVMLLLPPIPMKLRTLALVMIGLAIYTVVTSGTNAGGEAAHIGGALWGFVLIRNRKWLNWNPLTLSRRRDPR